VSGCLEKEIENIIGKFQGNNLEYVNTVYGSNEKAKTKLYELIWEPMEQHLKGVKNIYYSPSGLLHKISFSAIGIKKTPYYVTATILIRKAAQVQLLNPKKNNTPAMGISCWLELLNTIQTPPQIKLGHSLMVQKLRLSKSNSYRQKTINM